jgi:hypothetical protein
MMKKTFEIPDGDRVLIYRPCRRRPSGVVATLIGYRRAGQTFTY